MGVNASTAALLGAILLLTVTTELWSPLVPEYISALRRQAHAGSGAVGTILVVGCYGTLRDLMEALTYSLGGAIGGRLNTRRSLLLFNLLPLIGLGMLATSQSTLAVLLAIPFVFMWDSIAGPAIITVVGSSVSPDRRTMVFSIQSIVRRVSRIIAYGLSAGAIGCLGAVAGFRLAVGMGIVMLVAALVLQFRFMRNATSDAGPVMHQPLRLLRAFDPQLKRLLISDVFARWAEGIPRELVILYCIPLLADHRETGMQRFALLLSVQAVTNVLLYIIVGPMASRAGLAKRPFIGLTFVFFAAFPLALALLGPTLEFVGLVVAYVIGGLREIGEPARKAMISELVDPANRTQVTALYWALRGFMVMPAGVIGALTWLATDAIRPGSGPIVMLSLAGLIGLAGATWFLARFGK